MGLKFCSVCNRVDPEDKAMVYQGHYYCKKCRNPMSDLGSETSNISKSAKRKAVDKTSKKASVATLSGRSHMGEMAAVNLVVLECEDLVRKNPDNVEAHLTLAKSYFNEGKLSDAKDHLLKIMAIDPSYSKALLFMVTHFSDLKETASVLDHFPDDVEDLYALAKIYLDQNNGESAEIVLRRIVLLDSEHVESRQRLAELYLSEDSYKKAIQQLGVLQKIQSDPYVDYNMGVACYLAHDLKRALVSFNRVSEQTNDEALLASTVEYIDKISHALGTYSEDL